MSEELHLQPVRTLDALRTAVVVTIATLIGHVIPLVPFAVLERTPALVTAFVLSGLVLFGVGATQRSPSSAAGAGAGCRWS